MEPKWAIVAFAVIPLLIMLIVSWWAQSKMNKSNEKLIQAQQDTIYRLINREPVTYLETGEKQPKQGREAYAAWGNQTVEINEDESR